MMMTVDLLTTPSKHCAVLSRAVSEACVGEGTKAPSSLALALLQAFSIVPSLLEREIILFFSHFPAPSRWMLDGDDDSAVQCAKSMLLGLRESPEFLSSQWAWDDVLVLCEHHNCRVRWYGKQCLGLVLGVPPGFDDSDDDMLLEWKEILATQRILRGMIYYSAKSKEDVFVDEFALALSFDKNSILLEGPPSSGKTSLIESHRKDRKCIRIHLDDQMDAKSLLGGYVCTSKPGEFSWSPGPVVRAMQQGCWLVLENLNLASTEVMTLIQSLSKTKSIHIASRGQVINARHGFQLIATCTTLSSSSQKNLLPSGVRIQLNELSFNQQKHIMKDLFPVVSPMLSQVLTIAEALKNGADRNFTFRDVIKWGRRMVAFHSKTLTHGMPKESSPDIGVIPIPAREAACIELIDCACMSVPKSETRMQVASMIASHFAIPDSWIEQYMYFTKPSLVINGETCQIGRASLSLSDGGKSLSQSFAQTSLAMRLMERICSAICMNEPVLVVGETGVGKTTVIQEIARVSEKKFAVVNLSQQSDSSDLIGGFRPKSPGDDVMEILPMFLNLIKKTWKRGNNEEFLSRVIRLGKKKKWIQLLKAYKAAANKWIQSRENRGVKRKRPEDNDGDLKSLDCEWRRFHAELESMEATSSLMERGFAFGFTEGILVKAFKEGWWLLLDEINLAPTEVLEKIAGLLDNTLDGWTLSERGDDEEIARHPEFRIFGAMNPATDSGKKNLPPLVRNRFTEFWVAEPNSREDLLIIVGQHLGSMALQSPVANIVDLYLRIKEESGSILQDGAGIRPVYNLRTLTRALEYTRLNSSTYGIRRALVDGFAMSFQTQLDADSSSRLDRLLEAHLLPEGASMQSITNIVPEPPSPNHILFGQYWIEGGGAATQKSEKFIATPTVQKHLKNLARAVLLKRYPILLQGPTSSGKTSLITQLASATGHKCVRINNHEHTDIQEYIGFYISDSDGRLIFHEGPLVQALRHGYWVILDELNLAPSEVLEALNRLLDDNRELFVPELQEMVKPNKNFMLFATQNPPGIYAGRKTLSRAFRSRFLELHVDDIPDVELHEIIEKRCGIAPSYAKRMIAVMRDLQRRRSAGNLFAGRHGYITPRDLFRWANRPATSYSQLALNGFYVLGERLRSEEEREVVLQTLHRELKTNVCPREVYMNTKFEVPTCPPDSIGKIVWTPSFKRVYFLLEQCLRNDEPALLVGETGIGKTTACQLLAASMNRQLRILNCNQHTETSDFLGGYRPNRSRKAIISKIREKMSNFEVSIPKDVPDSQVIGIIQEVLKHQANVIPEDVCKSVLRDIASFQAPFEWIDGPLIDAMKNGDILLLDELNLAEDAVLERLNSVLESGRTITLAEKGGMDTEVIHGHANFQIIATMNPGGDFGKKELSPALMNRFTSIWVPQLRDRGELLSILCAQLCENVEMAANMIIEFCSFFEEKVSIHCRQSLSIRDILCWVQFMNGMNGRGMDMFESFIHGAELVIIDGLGLGSGVDEERISHLQSELQYALSEICKEHGREMGFSRSYSICAGKDRWGVAPFFIDCACSMDVRHFNFDAKTTRENVFRLVRAMQLQKPILLEGSPGVGKTTLIEAMSVAVGRNFVRINLSDQTDMMDLLGANLPSPNGGVGDFSWSDGPLLQAMKSGSWVLLDELNLACQSVLEGLNALLDHRGEIFVPELNSVVKCSSGFRVFGAQNPVQEGGGRKGLPRSFLNRFIRVRICGFSRADLIDISSSMFWGIPKPVIEGMTDCLLRCPHLLVKSSFDFNLRDLLRWCKLVEEKIQSASATKEGAERWTRFYGSILLSNRMRSADDRDRMERLLSSFFERGVSYSALKFTSQHTMLQCGSVELCKEALDKVMSYSPLGNCSNDHALIRSSFRVQEALSHCIRFNWLGILVGPTGCGKSACIADIALSLGKKVVEIQLHQGTDISDLLGGFEQIDMEREGYNIMMKIRGFLQRLALHLALAGQSLKSLQLLGCALFDGDTTHPDIYTMTSRILEDNKERFLELIDCIDAEDPRNCLASELDKLSTAAKEYLHRDTDRTGKFEWIDGTLTRCIIDGSWVILRDGNLCDPSILDRLNPLFEPGGVMSLNECGTTSDGPRVVVPHENFRMFITYDPINGEISRAMRNRGVEIYCSSFDHSEDSTVADLSAIVAVFGIPTKISNQIAQQWWRLSSEKYNLQSLARQARLLHALVCKETSVDRAVGLAFADLDGIEFRSDGISILEDLNIFLYPRIDQLYAGSATDKLLADWEFVLKKTRGTSSLGNQAEFDTLLHSLVFNKPGAFVLMNKCGCFARESVLERPPDLEIEAAVNAAMTVFVDEDPDNMLMRCRFLLNIMESTMSSTHNSEEKLQFCDMESRVVVRWLKELQSAHPEIAKNGHDVRFLLERYRLKELSKILANKGNLEECFNALEFVIWCHESPFCPESVSKHRDIAQWIWPILEGLYDLRVGEDEVTAHYSALSLFRQHLLAEPLEFDVERIAHSWSTLRAFLIKLESQLPPAITKLCENLSRSLLGDDSEVRAADRFLELLGRPPVPLNLQLHELLAQGFQIVGKFHLNETLLKMYHEDDSENYRGVILSSTIVDVRKEILDALEIVFAGSILDVDSTSQIKDILSGLAHFDQSERIKRLTISSDSKCSLYSLLVREGYLSWKGMASLDDVIARRMEVDLILRSCKAFGMQSRSVSAAAVVDAIIRVPSRSLVDALPYRVIVNFDESQSHCTSDKCLASRKRGIALMASLQMYRDLWLDYPSKDIPADRGPAIMHNCSGLFALCSIVEEANKISLSQLAYKSDQIHHCISSVCQMCKLDLTADVSWLEWKSALSMLLLLAESLAEEGHAANIPGLSAALEPNSSNQDAIERIHSELTSVFKAILPAERELMELLQESMDILIVNMSRSLSNTAEGMQLRGKSFALLSLVYTNLSRPYHAYDPVLGKILEKESLQLQIDQLYNPEIVCRQEYSMLPLSSPQKPKVSRLKDAVEMIRREKDEIIQSNSVRPEISQYLELKDDITEFIDHFVDHRVKHLLSAMEEADRGDMSCSQAQVWTENVNNFVKGLEDKYPCYKDIYGPIELSLRTMQYGIDLMRISQEFRAAESRELVQDLIENLLSINPKDLNLITSDKVLSLIETMDQRSKPETHVSEALKLYGFSLQILQRKLSAAVSLEQRRRIFEKFENISNHIHKLWKTSINEERCRVIEEEKSFEIKGRNIDLSEQEQEDKIFHSLFLESFSIFEDIEFGYEANESECLKGEPVLLAGNKHLLERKEVSDMTLARIFDLFTSIAGSSFFETSERGEEENSEPHDRLLSGMEMIKGIKGPLHSSLEQFCIPGFLYTLSREWKYLSDGIEKSEFDIYSRNTRESSRVLEPVNNLLLRVNELLEEWPEHPILDQLKKIGARILELPVSSALKDYSTGVDLLLSRAQIWEETAAKHVSLSDCLKPLVSIANSWRKLELNSWRLSLEKVREEIRKEARESWFFMFGIIREDLDSFADFINTMDSFIQGSTVGQFEERVNILQSFGNYLENRCLEHVPICQKKLMATSLQNMAAYYAQHVPAVEKHIAKEIKPLEKELADFVELAKWEDRGFYAMKSSKEKAYRQLHKIMRKAKDLLSTSCNVCLRYVAQSIGVDHLSGNGISSGTESLLVSFQYHTSTLSASKQDTLMVQNMAELGKYSKQIDRLLGKFKRISREPWLLEKLHSVAESMHQLSVAAFKQSAVLKGDVSKGAKSRKKKALTDYFKSLEGCGISKLQSSVPQFARDAHYWTRVSIPHVDDILRDIPNNPDQDIFWNTANSYYFKCISSAMQMMEVSRQPHEDIQSREIHVANNLGMHLLFLMQESRRLIGESIGCLQFFKKATYITDQIHEGNRISHHEYIHMQEHISACLYHNAVFADYLSTLIATSHGSLPLEKMSALLALLESARPVLLALSKQMIEERENTMELSDDKFYITGAMETLVKKECLSMKSLAISICQSCSNDIPGIRDLYDCHKALIEVFEGGCTTEKRKYSLNKPEFCARYEDLVQSCLVWAQNGALKESALNLDSMSELISGVGTSLALPSLTKVQNNVITCLEILCGDVSQQERAMMLNLSAILAIIVEKLQNTILYLLVAHRSLSKLGLVSLSIFCNLIKDGYCVPKAQGDEEEIEQTKEGTGLGDGDATGANDISNQLDDEDQILGAEKMDHTEEDKETEEKGNNESQGIEMEEDFHGQVEDVPEQPDNDQDEHKSDDEMDSEHLEQQMGDVESADEVDEKLWDQEDEKDDKVAEDNNAGVVENTDSLDYAQGNENDDDSRHEGNEDEQEGAKQEPEKHSNSDEGEEPSGDYEENVDTGLLEQQQPNGNMELPDEINLDDIENEEEEYEENESIECVSGDHEEGKPDDDGNEDSGEGLEDGSEHESKELEDMEVDQTETDTPADDHEAMDGMVAPTEDGLAEDQEELGTGPQKASMGDTQAIESKEVDGQGTSREEGGVDGLEGQVTVDKASEAAEKQNERQAKTGTNPFRSLSEAAQRWEKKNIIGDEHDDEHQELAQQGEAPESNQDHRFLREDENQIYGDTNMIADATEEQAQHAVQDYNEYTEDLKKEAAEEETTEIMEKNLHTAGKRERKEGTVQDNVASAAQDDQDEESKQIRETNNALESEFGKSTVRHLDRLKLIDDTISQDAQDMDSLQKELELRISQIQQEDSEESSDLEYGREVWSKCEALTSHLSGRLAEELRLILEPTLASKLGGEYRSGKRINMKRVIGYIASHFRKDKIWMRRTLPDKRRYQVLLAIDDSRSMAETSSGAFALESLALICNAMSRIGIGDLGIFRFGGSIGAELLHPLDKPFLPADGSYVMSKMRFNADNTIDDKPMVDLMTSVDMVLEKEGQHCTSALQQLVIILADGRFHEKGGLRKAVIDATSRPGVMYAYIILDNQDNSILDMQSVSFGPDGKPSFSRYIDSFPFPLYTVLQDIQHLPVAMADLLRQWIEYNASNMA